MDTPTPVNPYRNRGPLRRFDEFFGRRHELKEIYRAVEQGHSISLVGERRVGKTSILNALRFDEFRRAFHVDKELCFVSLNSQYCVSGDESGFIKLLVDQIAREARTVTRGSSPDVLRLIAHEVQSLVPRRRIIVLLDEVDALVHNRRISAEFFAYLRAWTEEFQIPFVVASKEGSVDELLEAGSLGSPFWNLFQPMYVGPLTPKESEELVRVPARRSGLEFGDDDVAQALSLGGHQPYFLQVACDCLFDAKLRASNTLDYCSVSQNFRFQADAHLSYLVAHIPSPERNALVSYLERGSHPDPKVLPGLLKRGLLIERGGTLQPFSRALGDVVRGLTVTEAPATTFFQRAAVFFRD